jgi:hypothetical protein
LSSFLAAGVFSRSREGVRGWVKVETRNKQNFGVSSLKPASCSFAHITLFFLLLIYAVNFLFLMQKHSMTKLIIF